MDLRRLLGINKHDERDRTRLGTLFAEIAPLVEGHTEDEIRLITGCAGLLGTVAYADMDMSAAERDKIGSILTEYLHLSPRQVAAIQKLITNHRIQLFALEDHVYPRLINAVTDRAQRMDLLRLLFALAAADRAISSDEEATLRTVAEGLQLRHRDYVTVRADFSHFRDVFKS
jgi:uncharacterized tellurite resistance protein B-like protein